MDDRPIDVFFSGNLNRNRIALYCELNPAMRWLSSLRDRRLLAVLLRSPLRRIMPMDFSAWLPGFNCEITFTSGFARGLTPAAYGEKLAHSKIVLCPRGFASTETFRHIEAMRAGAVVISEPLPDLPMYRDSPIITVDDWHQGLMTVTALLKNPAELRDRHKRSVAWYEAVLSETATAAAAARAIEHATGRTIEPTGTDV